MDTAENYMISLNNFTFTYVETKEYMINVLNGDCNDILLIILINY